MSDGGSHGGSSKPETDVSLTFIFKGCQNVGSRANLQIDLAPTLSTLMGLPMPLNSLGTFLEGILFSESHFTAHQRLYSAFVNARAVAQQYQRSFPADFVDGSLQFQLYQRAVKLYDDFLHEVGGTEEKEITSTFLRATDAMSSQLIAILVTFDLCTMTVAIVIFFQVGYQKNYLIWY